MSAYLSRYFLLPCALKETITACSSSTVNDRSSGVTEKLPSASSYWKCKYNRALKAENKHTWTRQWRWAQVQRKWRDETLNAQYRTSADQRRGAKTNRKGNESKMSYRVRIPPDQATKVKVRITLSFSCTSMFPAFFKGNISWLDLPSGADTMMA